MKKILFIALVATATLAASCTNDSDAITPSQGIQDNESFALKVGDTLPEDTGGQGGHTQPPPPPRP